MSIRQKLATARRIGARGTARLLMRGVARAIYTRETLVVFHMTPDQLNPIVPRLNDAERWIGRSADASTFLEQERAEVPGHLAAELRIAQPRQRVHWVEVGDRIVSWGFSTPWDGRWALTETRSWLAVRSGGVCLTAFETLPAYRGRRFYPAVLTSILQERFGEGAPVAYIWCRPDNLASYRSIERVGFVPLALHRYSRVLGVSRHEEMSAGA